MDAVVNKLWTTRYAQTKVELSKIIKYGNRAIATGSTTNYLFGYLSALSDLHLLTAEDTRSLYNQVTEFARIVDFCFSLIDASDSENVRNILSEVQEVSDIYALIRRCEIPKEKEIFMVEYYVEGKSIVNVTGHNSYVTEEFKWECYKALAQCLEKGEVLKSYSVIFG